MARDYPATIEKFKNIYGVGEKRSQDLGPVLLREISEHLSENPRKLFEKEKTPTPKKKPKERRQPTEEKLKLKQAKNIENGDPLNHGLPWAGKLELDLVNSYLDGKSVEELAKEFDRTKGGITSRLQHLAGVKFDELNEMSQEEKQKRLKS